MQNLNITLKRDINPLINYDHVSIKQGRQLIHLTKDDARLLSQALTYLLSKDEPYTEEITSELTKSEIPKREHNQLARQRAYHAR
jgi:hypothetical protein